jgi:enamine deaminase RidA (YjgF/YER057c/UK114 family)
MSGEGVEAHKKQRRPHRETVSTGSPWEPKMGYSRAVRIGSTIAVSGTVGREADGTFSASLRRQAERSLEIISDALKKLGASPEDVIRTRVYVVDAKRWEEVAEVHGKMFGSIRPACTLVQVARLIEDEVLIEIEADAIVQSDDD